MLTKLLLGVLVAVPLFFIVRYIVLRRSMSTMTVVDAADAAIEEYKQQRSKPSIKVRVVAYLTKLGWRGDLVPAGISVAFLYLLGAVALFFFGMPEQTSLILALPLALLIFWQVLQHVNSSKRKKFEAQLLQLNNILIGNLETKGAQAAIEASITNMPEPIYSEFTRALDEARVNKNLIESLNEVYLRYPSRAFKLILSALTINIEEGGPGLIDALSQASDLLQKQADLRHEAVSEVAQAKATLIFYIGAGGFVFFLAAFTPTFSTTSPFTTPLGLIATIVAAAWFGLGVFLALRIFKSIEGDLL